MCGRVDRKQIEADVCQDSHVAIFFLKINSLRFSRNPESPAGTMRERAKTRRFEGDAVVSRVTRDRRRGFSTGDGDEICSSKPH